MTRHIRLALALLALGLLAACMRPQPVAIRYGEAVGDYCGMLITDMRYGTEVVTEKGKVYVFDSIECMVAFLLEGEVPAEQVHSVWVTDFADPGTLIAATDALYLQAPTLRSPMGVNLAAFAGEEGLAAVRAEHEGRVLRYGDLAGVIREAGYVNHDHMDMAPTEPVPTDPSERP